MKGRQDQLRCHGRITVKIGGRLKTQQKNCNSKKPKYEWNEKNVFDDYLDLRNYVLIPHKSFSLKVIVIFGKISR